MVENVPINIRPDASLDELGLLWAARRSGVLEAVLSTAGTPDAVADAAGIDADAAAEFVAALDALGIVKRVDGEYQPTNGALPFLATRDIRSIGRLPAALDRLDDYAALAERVAADGTSGADPDDGSQSRSTTVEASGERATARHLGAAEAEPDDAVRRIVTAAVRAAPDADDILCVADGPGRHAREFAARGYRTALRDDPPVVDLVGPALADRDRLQVTTDPVGELGTFDLVVGVEAATLADDLDGFAAEARAAVAPGGTLFLVEPLRDGAGAAAAIGATLADGVGGVRPIGAHERALRDAGFGAVERREIRGDDRTGVVARR